MKRGQFFPLSALNQPPNEVIIIHRLPRLIREKTEKPFSEISETGDAVGRLLQLGERANEVLIEIVHLILLSSCIDSGNVSFCCFKSMASHVFSCAD